MQQKLLDSLNSQLYYLKISFDKAIVNGNCLAEVKRIYKQIQELESRIIEVRVEILKGGKHKDEDENQ